MKQRFNDIAMVGIAMIIIAVVSPLAIYQMILWNGNYRS